MREKKSFKRTVALLLAAVLTFTTFSSDINVYAEGTKDSVNRESNLSVSTTTKDGIELGKSAVLNNDGTVDITFKVDGNNTVEYRNETANTDIILVLDTSRSMSTKHSGLFSTYYTDDENSKIYKAKNAAKAFVNQVFAAEGVTDENVRIGVVTFWKRSKVVSNLTNRANKQTLLNNIDGIASDDSTNIQAGIHEARNLFGSSNNNNKIIVVMSDGEANFCYDTEDDYYDSTFSLNTDAGTSVPVAHFDYGYITDEFYLAASADGKIYYYDAWYDENGNRLNVTVNGTIGEGNTGTYEVSKQREVQHKQVFQYGSNYYFNRSWSRRTGYTYSDQVPSQYANDSYINRYSYINYYMQNGSRVFVPLSSVTSHMATTYYYNYTETKTATYHYKTTEYDDIKYAAVMEAQLAKNAGVKFYTVKYDTNNADALFALKNIASMNSETNAPLFYESAVDSISNIFSQIATSVGHDVAAAKGTSVTDELPTYMNFFIGKDGKYVLTGDTKGASIEGSKLTWNLNDYDLSKDKTYTLTVRCTVDLQAMISAYAKEHGMTVDAVKETMKDSSLTFSLNKKVTLSYTDISGNSVENTDLNATANTVPYTSYTTYPYGVTYTVNGQAIDTEETYYDVAGEEITYSENLISSAVKTEFPVSLYNYAVDKETITVNSSTKEVFNVSITSKTATVSFVSTTPSGDVAVCEDQTVAIGSAATNPFADEALKAQYEALYNQAMATEHPDLVYTFNAWESVDGNNSSISNIQANGTFKATFSSAKKKFNVTFDTSAANGAEWAKAVANVENLEYGNTVSEPSDVIDNTKLPTGVASIGVTWKLNGEAYDFSSPVTDNITLVADYQTTMKQYTVKFVDFDGAEIASETVTHGNTIPNFASKTVADKVTDEIIYHWNNTWSAVEGQTSYPVYADTVVTSDLVLHPGKEEWGNNFTITWKFKDPSNAQDVTRDVTNVKRFAAQAKPDSVNAQTFEYHGVVYTLTGWSLESATSSTVNTGDASVSNTTGNVTFVANYTTEQLEYTFTFNYKDASGNDVSDTVEHLHWGDEATAPSLPSYDVVDDNGDVVETVTQTGWDNDAYLHVEADGSASAISESTAHYIITFVDSITGETLSRQNVLDGESPVEPEFTHELITGRVKKEASEWNTEITPASENATYYTVVTTSIKCDAVHMLNGEIFGDVFDERWVEENTTYTTTDTYSYPYVTTAGTKYERADSNDLSICATADNYRVVIALKECEKGTIAFYNYKNQLITSSTGYVGDALKIDVPTVTAPENTFTTVNKLADGWFTDAEGKNAYTGSFTYATGLTNLYAKELVSTRTFTLKFFDENGNFLSEVTGLSDKDAIISAVAGAKEPTKKPTEEFIFNGSWDAVVYVDANGLTDTAIDNWALLTDDSTSVTFGTKAKFTDETRYYHVYFKVGDETIKDQKVTYKAAASAPEGSKIEEQMTGDAYKNKQFIGWDKPFNEIKETTTVNAVFADKHTLTYVNEDGTVLLKDVYPKFGIDSYVATVVSAADAKADKVLGKTAYHYDFKGWKLDEETVKQEGDTVDLSKGDVTLTATYNEDIPGYFFVRNPWEGMPVEPQGHDSEEYSSGRVITKDNFDYDKYNADAKYIYLNADTASVIKETAPKYENFLGLTKSVPEVASLHINATVDWYVVKIQKDGIHIDGYPTYVHDSVSVSAMYDGTNQAEALYNEVVSKADGVRINKAEFLEKAGELKNVTSKSFTIDGTLTVGATRAANSGHDITVKMPITLAVTARDVVLTSATSSKVYDREALKSETVEVTGSGFVAGDAPTYSDFAEITNVGSVENTFTYTFADGVAANYDVTVNYGTLTISSYDDEVVVYVKGATDEVTYDKEDHVVKGYEVSVSGNDVYKVEDVDFVGTSDSVSGNDAGTYDMGISGNDFVNTNTNFTNVKFVVEDGKLVVNKKPLTITINSTAKTEGDLDPRLTYTVEGLIDGDDLKVDLYRDPGEGTGTRTIHARITVSPNYEVTVKEGTLRIDEIVTYDVVDDRPAQTDPTPGQPAGPQPGGGQPGGGQPADAPTQVAGETVEETPVVTIDNNEVPMAAAPAEGKQGMKIEDEDVPMAVLSQCYIHWVILAIALVYAIYATLRAVQNKKELEDNEELAKNNN